MLKKTIAKNHRKKPSHKAIRHSAQVRFATHIHLATHFAGRLMSSYYKSDLRCASPSAHESGIFCLLFFRRLFASSLLTKSRSPHAVGTGVANALKATNDVIGSNALDKRAIGPRACPCRITTFSFGSRGPIARS